MKEKIERNIDKDIERCKELIKIEHSNWIGMSNQDAISNVLSDREMWKKIAEKLADELAGNDNYMQNIIDWARKEVENEIHS